MFFRCPDFMVQLALGQDWSGKCAARYSFSIKQQKLWSHSNWHKISLSFICAASSIESLHWKAKACHCNSICLHTFMFPTALASWGPAHLCQLKDKLPFFLISLTRLALTEPHIAFDLCGAMHTSAARLCCDEWSRSRLRFTSQPEWLPIQTTHNGEEAWASYIKAVDPAGNTKVCLSGAQEKTLSPASCGSVSASACAFIVCIQILLLNNVCMEQELS